MCVSIGHLRLCHQPKLGQDVATMAGDHQRHRRRGPLQQAATYPAGFRCCGHEARRRAGRDGLCSDTRHTTPESAGWRSSGYAGPPDRAATDRLRAFAASQLQGHQQDLMAAGTELPGQGVHCQLLSAHHRQGRLGIKAYTHSNNHPCVGWDCSFSMSICIDWARFEGLRRNLTVAWEFQPRLVGRRPKADHADQAAAPVPDSARGPTLLQRRRQGLLE